jgi:succinyl-CoA synthetase alpha subunit
MAPQTAVVVTFYSRCGATETLALAAAVGAVQGRCLIRLRRLSDQGSVVAGSPECEETLARMRKEYVAPSEKDVLGNPALILVPSAGATPESSEWAEFSAMLARLGSEGKLTGKVGAIVDSGNPETARSFISVLERAGLRRADAAPASGDLALQATATGRKVAAAAQA